MRIDVNAFVGGYPFRRVPGTSADALLGAMDRVRIDQAWVSHLPSVFWRNPADGNAWLYETAAQQRRFRAVPSVHPGVPGWERVVSEAKTNGAAAVRCDPTHQGLDPAGAELRALAAACGATGVPLQLTVRFEDGRQRHPRDGAPELPAAAVRALVRCDAKVRFVITHADRGFIEEVHFGSTPQEADRLSWDVSWIWGPPEDHFALLLGTVGVERFVFGTGQPLRIPEASVAKLELTDLTAEQRTAVESGNAQRLHGS